MLPSAPYRLGFARPAALAAVVASYMYKSYRVIVTDKLLHKWEHAIIGVFSRAQLANESVRRWWRHAVSQTRRCALPSTLPAGVCTAGRQGHGRLRPGHLEPFVPFSIVLGT